MFPQMAYKRCTRILVREHWFMGECRGEADVLYLEIEDRDWFAFVYDRNKQAYTATPSTAAEAQRVFGSGESRHPVRDIGKQYGLNDCMITGIDQQALTTGGELCVTLDNASEITIHVNSLTEESSLYITHH